MWYLQFQFTGNLISKTIIIMFQGMQLPFPAILPHQSRLRHRSRAHPLHQFPFLLVSLRHPAVSLRFLSFPLEHRNRLHNVQCSMVDILS